jgi:hypothetical protein
VWTYRQTDGFVLNAKGEHVATGYSGAGHTAATGRNNPDMEDVHNKGPIPRGRYKIGAPHVSPHTGPFTMDLDPEPGTDTHGRGDFRIHGNNAENDASHGCIILPPDGRHLIWESGDHEIEVGR